MSLIVDVTYCFRSTLLMALILMLSRASGDMVITECLCSLERCSDILWLITGLNPSHQWGNNPLSAEGNNNNIIMICQNNYTIVMPNSNTEWKSHSVNAPWVTNYINVYILGYTALLKEWFILDLLLLVTNFNAFSPWAVHFQFCNFKSSDFKLQVFKCVTVKHPQNTI